MTGDGPDETEEPSETNEPAAPDEPPEAVARRARGFRPFAYGNWR